MSRNKSISQRLRDYPAHRKEIINDWLDNWHREQKGMLKKLENACFNDEQAYQALTALHAITHKKFIALKNIFLKLEHKKDD